MRCPACLSWVSTCRSCQRTVTKRNKSSRHPACCPTRPQLHLILLHLLPLPPPPLSSSPSAHLSFPSLTPSTRCHIPRSRTLLSLRTADVHGAAALCVPPSVTCCLSRLTNPACLLLLYPTRQHRLRFSSGSHLISTGRVDVELPTLTSFTIRLLSQRTFEFIYLEPLQYSTRVTRYRSTSPDRYLSFTMPGKTGMPSPLLRARSKCSGLTCFQRL